MADDSMCIGIEIESEAGYKTLPLCQMRRVHMRGSSL